MLPKTILVPTDLSEEATRALDYACELASRLGATVHILNVINGPSLGMPELINGTMVDTLIDDHRVMVDDLVDRYRVKAMMGKGMLEVGDATAVITETAMKINADLIVMGTHGRRGVSRFLLGSIAETVVRRAVCPVLTIHTHDKPEELRQAS